MTNKLVYNQLLSLRQQLEREAADQSEDEADRTEEFIPFNFFDFHENIFQVALRVPVRTIKYHAC